MLREGEGLFTREVVITAVRDGRVSSENIRRQIMVVVDGSRYELDLAGPELKLAVELDGAAYHGGKGQRERDVRPAAALATLGWQVIRVTHARITSHPDDVRSEVATIIAARRRQLTA